jgi:hypothetical protein
MATGGNGGGKMLPSTKDVVRSALASILAKGLLWGLGGLALLIALLVWKGGTVPAWIAAVLLVAALGLAGFAYSQMRRLKGTVATKDERIGELEPLAEALPELQADLERLAGGLERHDVYGNHIAKMLDQLQRVVARELDVPIPQYVERGILQPARDLLIADAGGDVRLSILLPRVKPDEDRWRMVLSAGHSVTGGSKYDARIVDTLSRLPFETGEIYWSEDVVFDDRFEANPHATRETHAMISLPLRQGDRCFGVLNVVSSLPGVFDIVERRYLESLTSVVSVALGVFLQDQVPPADA